jgi:hypothetical protein
MWYFAYGSNMQSDTLRGRRGVPFRRALAVRGRRRPRPPRRPPRIGEPTLRRWMRDALSST